METSNTKNAQKLLIGAIAITIASIVGCDTATMKPAIDDLKVSGARMIEISFRIISTDEPTDVMLSFVNESGQLVVVSGLQTSTRGMLDGNGWVRGVWTGLDSRCTILWDTAADGFEGVRETHVYVTPMSGVGQRQKLTVKNNSRPTVKLVGSDPPLTPDAQTPNHLRATVPAGTRLEFRVEASDADFFLDPQSSPTLSLEATVVGGHVQGITDPAELPALIGLTTPLPLLIPNGGMSPAMLVEGVALLAGTIEIRFLATDNHGTTGNLTISVTVTNSTSAKLAVTAAPENALAGQPLGAVCIEIQDSFGNRVTTAVGDITLTLDPPAVLVGTTMVPATTGEAIFSPLAIHAAGTYRLIASAAGLSPAFSTPFTISAGAPTHIEFAIQPASIFAGQTMNAIEVRLSDAFGNPATAAAGPISLAINPAFNPVGAVLIGTTAVAPATGIARFDDVRIARAGTALRLQAHVSGVGSVTSDAFDIAPAVPASVGFVVGPNHSAAATAMSPAIAVGVFDAFGNLTWNAVSTVTLSLFDNPNSGVLSGAIMRETAGGVATFGDLSIDVAASGYTLRASAAVGTAISNAFDISSGTPAALRFVGAPVQTTVGQPLAPIHIEIIDAGGNRVATTPIGVTIAVDSPAALIPHLHGTTTKNSTAAGLVTFDDLTFAQLGATVRLRAAAPGLSSSISAPFDVVGTTAPSIAQPVGPGIVTATAGGATAVVQPGETLNFSVVISDPDIGDSIAVTVQIIDGSLTPMAFGFTQFPLSVPTGPSPATVDFAGVAGDGPGWLAFRITATDASANTLMFTMTLSINAPPVIAAPDGLGNVGVGPAFTAVRVPGASLNFTVNFTDADAVDTLTAVAAITAGNRSLVELGFTQFPATSTGATPIGLAFAGTAALPGWLTVTFSVSDGRGGVATATLTIIVNAPPTFGAPTGLNFTAVGQNVFTASVDSGAAVTIQLTAHDAEPHNPLTLSMARTGGSLSLAESGFSLIAPATGDSPLSRAIVSGNADKPGIIEFTATVTDNLGASTSMVLSLTIQPGAAASIEILSGNLQHSRPKTTLPSVCMVQVRNANGHPIANTPVTFQLLDRQGEIVNGATQTANAAGEAFAVWKLGHRRPNQRLVASTNNGLSVTFTAYLPMFDFNGDGHEDLLVGDSLNKRVYVYLGNAAGFEGPYAPVLMVDNNPAVGPYNTLGRCLAVVGDVNGDGFDDFVYSYSRSNGRVDAHLVLGRAQTSGALHYAATYYGKANDNSIEIVPLADIDGDGYADWAIAAPYRNQYRGAVDIVFGSPNPPTTLAVGKSFVGAADYDSVGKIVSGLGDVDGDGFDDVGIGAGNSAFTGIYYGRPRGDWPYATGPDTRLLSNGAPTAVGDVNGDGFDDFASNFNATTARLFLGGPNRPATLIPSNGVADMPAFIDAIGFAGDTNGDGFDDVVITQKTGLNGTATTTFRLVLGRENPSGILTPMTWRSYNTQYATTSFAGGFDLNRDGRADVQFSYSYHHAVFGRATPNWQLQPDATFTGGTAPRVR